MLIWFPLIIIQDFYLLEMFKFILTHLNHNIYLLVILSSNCSVINCSETKFIRLINLLQDDHLQFPNTLCD